jgi:hypothetical protein
MKRAGISSVNVTELREPRRARTDASTSSATGAMENAGAMGCTYVSHLVAQLLCFLQQLVVASEDGVVLLLLVLEASHERVDVSEAEQGTHGLAHFLQYRATRRRSIVTSARGGRGHSAVGLAAPLQWRRR